MHIKELKELTQILYFEGEYALPGDFFVLPLAHIKILLYLCTAKRTLVGDKL